MARVGVPVGSVDDVARRSSSANIASLWESWVDEDLLTGAMQRAPSLWSSEAGSLSMVGCCEIGVRQKKNIKKIDYTFGRKGLRG